jgi:quinohemoprotein ethanol dehydrogenase
MTSRSIPGRIFTLGALATLAMTAGCRHDPERTHAAGQPNESNSANWVSYGRTASEQRFSPLTQINERSVARLGLVWALDLGTLRGLEATPLMRDGVLYTTSAWNLVYAADAKTGRLLWTYDPHVPKEHAKFVCCDVVNRGVALYENKVYTGTLDGRLVALDATTGRPVWEVQTTPKSAPYAITGAPRIAKGRVIIGNAGSEYAVRGYLSAYDAVTGELVWRTYTVPGDPSRPFESEAMRRAATTWSGDWWKRGGGGSPWEAIVYDPDLDLVLFGTGNASPWYPELRGKETGDNLYAASIVAVRAATGAYVWHFQTTPGDAWDYDATQPLVLADLTIAGRARRVVMQANKNGFFYVLDRENGRLISARPYTDVTWATGLDAEGRPVGSARARALNDPTIVKPAPDGAHNWNPISFNPTTGLMYFGVVDAPFMHAVDPKFAANVHDMTVGYDTRYAGPVKTQWNAMKTSGRLVAWDPVAQREVWRVDHPDPKSGGTLTTAGNLVFQGRADGMFRAYRATDATMLWEFDAGVGVAAAPMTYAIDGTQYIAVMAGWGGPEVLHNSPLGKGKVGPGHLLVFALDGTATFPRYTREIPAVPTPEFRIAATAADITEGAALYAQYCQRCHGLAAASGGSVPDLRLAELYVHKGFEEIVRGGARREFGMPSFEIDLTPAQVRQIHAYVLDRARASAGARTTH